MEKSVSIIIPSYNVELYLEKCVEALVLQLDIHDEIIIVNDGSTDNTENIGISLSQRYDKVTYLYKTNGGLSSARNFGVKHAKKEFITFVDADDFVADNYLKKLKENITADTDVVGFGLCRIVENSENVGVSPMLLGSFYSQEVQNKLLPEIICNEKIFHRNLLLCSACTYLYNREFLIKNEIQFLSERIYLNEDLLFNVEVFSKAKNVHLISDILYFYVCRTGSLTQKFHPNIYETKQNMCLESEKIIEKSGLIKSIGNRLECLWIKGIYECIVHTIWKYSEYDASRQRILVKKYLSNERLAIALSRVSNKKLNNKGKVILYLMKHKMVLLIQKLYIMRKN